MDELYKGNIFAAAEIKQNDTRLSRAMPHSVFLSQVFQFGFDGVKSKFGLIIE